MAKVSVEFDSKTKEMSVKIDGTELDDVKSVNIYKYEDENPRLNIVMERENVDGFEIYTTLYANQEGNSYASEDKTLVNINKIPEQVTSFLTTLL